MSNYEKWLKVKAILISVFKEAEHLGYEFEKEESFQSVVFKNGRIFVFKNEQVQLKFLFCPRAANDLLSVCAVKNNQQTLWLTSYWTEKMELDSTVFDLGSFEGTFDEKIKGWVDRIFSIVEKDKKIQSVLQGKGWINFVHFWEKV